MFVSVLSWIYLSSVCFSRSFNVARGPLFVYPWHRGQANDETENSPLDTLEISETFGSISHNGYAHSPHKIEYNTLLFACVFMNLFVSMLCHEPDR
jgi:hypothetical protein